MDTIQAIKSRTSVRRYSDRPISDADLHTILEASMSGPSAVNARPWSFLVVRDKAMLASMAEKHGPYSGPLKGAQMAIIVCGDMARTFPTAPDYWVVDSTIAAQNMILAAHALGIGSVWLGTWPQKERIAVLAEMFCLPESIVPHSVIAFGYPAEPVTKEKLLYEADRVHFENW